LVTSAAPFSIGDGGGVARMAVCWWCAVLCCSVVARRPPPPRRLGTSPVGDGGGVCVRGCGFVDGLMWAGRTGPTTSVVGSVENWCCDHCGSPFLRQLYLGALCLQVCVWVCPQCCAQVWSMRVVYMEMGEKMVLTVGTCRSFVSELDLPQRTGGRATSGTFCAIAPTNLRQLLCAPILVSSFTSSQRTPVWTAMNGLF